MKIMIVDDEKLVLRSFQMYVEAVEDMEIAGAFNNPSEALEFAGAHPVQAALLDIEMPGMSGISLAEELRKIDPKMVIVFITGHEKYASDALKVKADYYITKPYDQDDLEDLFQRIRLLSRRQDKRVRVRTFGRFDVFIDGQAVVFKNAKAKELLALCIDRRGGLVTLDEAIDKLWENRIYDEKVKNLYRKAVMYLKQLFKDADAEDVFFNVRGACAIRPDTISCDLYQLLLGDRKAREAYKLIGRYLSEYSWAEESFVNLEKYYY